LKHEEVAELAVSISNSQREEIFMMRNWLAGSYTTSDQRFRDGMMSGMGMMRRSGSNFDRYLDLSEEELEEIRELQREELRTVTRIEVIMEEYRQLIKDGASDQELRSIEDQIFELQEELDNSGTGFFSGSSGLSPYRIRQHCSW